MTRTALSRAGWYYVTFALLLLGSVQIASAQSIDDAFRFTDRLPATGTRMTGLAGAGASGIADYAALLANPAGLGWIQASSFSGAFNTGITADRASSSISGFTPNNMQVVIANASLGNMAYVYRAPTRRGSFVAAVAFNQVHSFNQELDFYGTNSSSTITTSFLPFDGEYSLSGDELDTLDDLPYAAFNAGLVEFYPELLQSNPNAYPFLEAVVPGQPIDQSGKILQEGTVHEISFGAAIEIARNVMTGVSINIPFGRYDFNSTFREDDTGNLHTADDYSVLLDSGRLLEGFDHLSYRQSLQSILAGVNVRAGLSAGLSSNLRLGLTIETPTVYTIEETFRTRYFTRFDDGATLEYGGRDDDIGNGFYDYEILTPWRVSAGLQYESGMLTLLADAEFVSWSQMRFEAKTDQAFFDDLNRGIDENYTGTINPRVAAEVRLGAFELRGGAALKQDPRKTAPRRSDGSLMDRDRIYYTAGLGYNISKRFRIDVGWIGTQFDSAYHAYPEDDAGPRQDAGLQIDERITQDHVVLGATYWF